MKEILDPQQNESLVLSTFYQLTLKSVYLFTTEGRNKCINVRMILTPSSSLPSSSRRGTTLDKSCRAHLGKDGL